MRKRAIIVLLAVAPLAAAGATGAGPCDAGTFSIVAYDAEAQEWGVAVASRVLAVGYIVPWAKAGVGAIATQAYADIGYGLEGLNLLEECLTQ